MEEIKSTKNVTMQIQLTEEQIEKFFESRKTVLEKIDSIMKLEKVEKTILESIKILGVDEEVEAEFKQDFELQLKSCVLHEIIINSIVDDFQKHASDEDIVDMLSDELVDECIESLEEAVRIFDLKSKLLEAVVEVFQ